MDWWLRLFRHAWGDARDSLRAVPDGMADRLAGYITASERRHSGEIRICVEAALPLSYLWRARGRTPVAAVVRQRAMAWFGRLRIWDTEQNNGVLIYLLLSEHAIELVADRAICRVVDPGEWEAIVERLGRQLGAGDFEAGLTAALEEVSALLVRHFPADRTALSDNELPDTVVRV
ncbi:MAG TPA: TPM domain-containing protein [Hydrogenophaga sp.]|uniref:TPM domain-containing protein n=1 Tax=Hydrogenophaga sp. TaxID=1904254 RepID=UPI002C9DB2A1|nr:TPM domain-containing protein [Hydrogenophaga sp.]HMN92102.1 TPM domain-containing protein [Hydrogenophaga sp.]HMP10530.1 TPM domain-containing protein [Hydrogenophaga sp.]